MTAPYLQSNFRRLWQSSLKVQLRHMELLIRPEKCLKSGPTCCLQSIGTQLHLKADEQRKSKKSFLSLSLG